MLSAPSTLMSSSLVLYWRVGGPELWCSTEVILAVSGTLFEGISLAPQKALISVDLPAVRMALSALHMLPDLVQTGSNSSSYVGR